MTSSGSSHRVGFTLIELTVVLAVLVTLALVLTPSITNFINDSRVARTRTDTQTLAAAVVQFYKDNGFFPQWVTASAGGPGTAANRRRPARSARATCPRRGGEPVDDGHDGHDRGAVDGQHPELHGEDRDERRSAGTARICRQRIGADAWNNRYMINVGLIDTSQGTQTAGWRDQERGVGHLGRRQRTDRNGLQPADHDRGRER